MHTKQYISKKEFYPTPEFQSFATKMQVMKCLTTIKQKFQATSSSFATLQFTFKYNPHSIRAEVTMQDIGLKLQFA